MQKSTENVAESPKFCTLTGNRGRRIERRCLNLHRKLINNSFCACALQMLLEVAGNATKCSTFEVQYGKSTSTRTTAITHFRATLTERVVSLTLKLSLTQKVHSHRSTNKPARKKIRMRHLKKSSVAIGFMCQWHSQRC